MSIVDLFHEELDRLETPWVTSNPELADRGAVDGYYTATDVQLGLITHHLTESN